MAKTSRFAGSTSNIVEVYIRNVNTGVPLTGIAIGGGLTLYYKRSLGTASVSAPLNTINTFGVFNGSATNGAFKEVDSANMPGVYELHLPNNAMAAGDKSVVFILKGATNMETLPIEIELTATDNQDPVRGGLTALPNGQMTVKKNQALAGFAFPMTGSTDHQMATGLTVTAQRVKDGGAIATCDNPVVEIGGGFYKVDLTANDLNAVVVAFKFSAAGADDLPLTLITEP